MYMESKDFALWLTESIFLNVDVVISQHNLHLLLNIHKLDLFFCISLVIKNLQVIK